MIVCLDLGATEIKCANINKGPEGLPQIVGEVKKVPTNAHLGKKGILEALSMAIAMHLTQHTRGIAIASAGDVSRASSKIIYATDNLPGMTGFDFAAFCKEHFSLPVKAINDAHAALLGEMAYGAGKAYQDKRVAMLTLGSGVGGGYFAEGDIVSTQENDFGRFGHICLYEEGRACTCGKKGCAETYLSGRALHADAKTHGVDGDNLFKHYALGVNDCLHFVNGFRENLKRLLDKMQQTSPFDVCLIGGGVVNWMGDDFEAVTKGLGHRLIKAELRNHAGIYGAFYNYTMG